MADTLPQDKTSKIDLSDSAACYEATQAQQDAIEKEINSTQALISTPLELDTLSDDFSGHDIYLQKLEVLKKKYKHIRRLRRDGNCFYRAFGFGYLEYIISTSNKAECERFRNICSELKDFLISQGYTQFTVEDFHEQFVALLDRAEEGMPFSELEDAFNQQGVSDYYVVFLRLIVSAYLQKNEDFFKHFIDQCLTMKQFCETEVEPMRNESDNIHLTALTQALDVCIRLENCQLSGDLTTLIFPESKQTTPVLTLLYRPGHYDILYA